MASGADHYRAAEECLTEARSDFERGYLPKAEMTVTAAQVHATLALAGAMAYDQAQRKGGHHEPRR